MNDKTTPLDPGTLSIRIRSLLVWRVGALCAGRALGDFARLRHLAGHAARKIANIFDDYYVSEFTNSAVIE